MRVRSVSHGIFLSNWTREVLLSLALILSAASVDANELTDHPSPYLAMHGDDPVKWQDWRSTLLTNAREQDKLVFVSSGYFACHWCHVMQRESYRDDEIAKRLNRSFITVKLDRELHPALDAYLVNFVQQTRGNSGWPLNVFMTPEGYPLVGFTYLPPVEFETFITRLAERWDNAGERARLKQAAIDAADALRVPATDVSDEIPAARDIAYTIEREAMTVADQMSGGFGQQNKFPMVPRLMVLVDVYQRWPDEALGEFLILTLAQMAVQGMRDHVGGGFFRYTVDPDWRTPHFEKMLYNQAQMVSLYLKAGQVFNEPYFSSVALDTLEFSLAEFAHPEGGYYASFSAVDDKDEEGGYYLWDATTLKSVLTRSEFDYARYRWGMDGIAPFNPGYLPIETRSVEEAARELGTTPAVAEGLEQTVKTKLLAQRKKRGLPIDRKQLLGWNALMLTALIDAWQVTGDRRYYEQAAKLKVFILDWFYLDGQLVRARYKDQPLGEAAIEDYAYLLSALQRWNNLVGEDNTAVFDDLLLQAFDLFYVDGGWRTASGEQLPGMERPPTLEDGALPSPSAILLDVALSQDTNRAVSETAKAHLAKTTSAVTASPFWEASHSAILMKHMTRADN